MSSEDEVKSLKLERSTLRAKVKTAANSLQSAIQQNKDIDEIEQIYGNLQLKYDDFTVSHLTYEEIVNSDSSYESYKTVNNLDLESYCKAVEDIHDKALTSFVTHKASKLNQDATLLLSKVKTVIEELDKVIDTTEVANIPATCTLLDETLAVLDNARKLSAKLNTNVSDSKSLYDSILSYILELDVKTFKVKQILSSCDARRADEPARILDNRGENGASPSSNSGAGPVADAQHSAPSGGTASQSQHTNQQLDLPQNSSISVNMLKSFYNPMPKSLSVVSAYDGSSEHYSMASPLHNSAAQGQDRPTQVSYAGAKFKRAPPPTFSGNRNEWPEFRAIWRRYGGREFPSDEERAWALKESLKGRALEHVRAIFVTQPNAYNRMWDRLDNVYSDVSHNIEATFEQMFKLKPVNETDLRALVTFVNEVEMCYSRLGEIGQLSAVTLNQIDKLSDLLPINSRKEWMRQFRQLTTENKIHPFSPFMEFLENERSDSLRLAERAPAIKIDSYSKRSDQHKTTRSNHTQLQAQSNLSNEYNQHKVNTYSDRNTKIASKCAVHDKPGVTHATEVCRDFQALTIDDKYDVLKRVRYCFRCLGRHRKNECKANKCSRCDKTNHHLLLCRMSMDQSASKHENQDLLANINEAHDATMSSNSAKTSKSVSLFPIMDAPVTGGTKRAQILFDGGSDCSYITHESAKTFKTKRLGQVALDVVTMGGSTAKHITCQYEIPLMLSDGDTTLITAYGMEQITGPVSKLDEDIVKQLFPHFNPSYLQRKSATVDILIGNDYYGLHPKKELAKRGEHLSIMEGSLGICLQGSHPQLWENTKMTTNLIEMQSVIGVERVVHSNTACTISVNHVGLTSKSYANVVSQGGQVSTFTTTGKEEIKTSLIDYKRFNSCKRLQWVMARVISAIKHKSFKGGSTVNISTDTFVQAHELLVREVQRTMTDLNEDNKGQYKKLKPKKTLQNTWVIGGRMSCHNPLTSDTPQWLLPTKHEYTRLLMKEAHEMGGHRGRDGTLARFRQSYWVPQGAKVAKAVKDACQLCRVRDVKLLKQEMGQLPVERLRPTPPFNNSMVDLFGPYLVRGEVQKRISGKAYEVIFTDWYSRAVHIEAVFGYDTQSFILALIRFASMRGWPAKLFSDPGTQLIGAEREIVKMWQEIDKEAIYKLGIGKGTQWTFGPADSPWRQGAVESLIKATKRCFKLAINQQRISPTQLLTLCAEVSNILNERPLGTLPGEDSDINILTPNCLLLGRSQAANFGGWTGKHNFKDQLGLMNDMSNRFWKHWTELYAPTLVKQQKWHKPTRNLQPEDIVAIADQNSLRGKYHIAKVDEVYPGRDSKVRRVTLSYKNFKLGEKLHTYKGASDTKITRSVQRLALLVPVDGSGSA